MIRLMATAASLTPEDFIKKTVGNILFLYYTYLNYFKNKPRDIEDIVDGLLFIEATDYISRQKLAAAEKPR